MVLLPLFLSRLPSCSLTTSFFFFAASAHSGSSFSFSNARQDNVKLYKFRIVFVFCYDAVRLHSSL